MWPCKNVWTLRKSLLKAETHCGILQGLGREQARTTRILYKEYKEMTTASWNTKEATEFQNRWQEGVQPWQPIRVLTPPPLDQVT